MACALKSTLQEIACEHKRAREKITYVPTKSSVSAKKAPANCFARYLLHFASQSNGMAWSKNLERYESKIWQESIQSISMLQAKNLARFDPAIATSFSLVVDERKIDTD